MNPWTGKQLTTAPLMKLTQASSLIHASAEFQRAHWRKEGWSSKTALCQALSARLRAHSKTHANIISEEMGKPYKQAVAEVLKCADLVDYYASNAERILTSFPVKVPGFDCEVRYEPLGVIFGVMPWNYPYWQVYRWAVPTILAGNTAVFKHASNVTMSAKQIEEDFVQAGFDSNILVNLQVGVGDVSAVISHPAIRGISFTGSSSVGKELASLAGKNVKKAVIELGGSDACVVLESAADISEVAKKIVQARMHNTGQSCISPKRVILVSKHIEEFMIAAIRVGKSLRWGVEFGPVSSVKAKDQIEDQVSRAVSAGAVIRFQHSVFTGSPCHSPPRIITGVTESSPLASEEVFGPVLVVIEVPNDKEALRIANSSPFGLGFSVFGSSEDCMHAVDSAEAGMCFVKAITRSDPGIPFGGVKESGIGRECGESGMKEFTNVKSVWVKKEYS